MDYGKKYFITLLVSICSCFFFIVSFSQETDSLKLKLEKFDSLDFYEKQELVKEYVESDFNSNEANLFILKFFKFLQPIDFQIYKNTFDKTSFSTKELKSDSLYFLLDIKLEESNIDHALEIHQIMEDQDSKWFKLSSELLSSYFYDIDSEKSLRYYEQYFKFDALKHINTKGETPSYWRDVNEYFRLLFKNQKYDTIIIYSDSILKYRPNDERWLTRKAEAQYYSKKYENASETYCELYEIDNEFKYVQQLLRVYKKLNDTLSTLSLLTENIDLRGEKDIQIRFLYFDYIFYFELHELKVPLIKEVLQNKPEFYSTTVPSEAFYYYSFFQAHNDEINQAVNTILKAIEIVINLTDSTNQNSPYTSLSYTPNFNMVFDYYLSYGNGNMLISKYFNTIGDFYNHKRKTKEALKAFLKALDYYHCNYISHYSIADIQKNNFWRSSKKAISHYEKIISCDVYPYNSQHAISELGKHYYNEKKYQKAIELLNSEKEFGYLKSKDYFTLSQIYLKLENYSESHKMIDKAIELEENKDIINLYDEYKEIIIALSKI